MAAPIGAASTRAVAHRCSTPAGRGGTTLDVTPLVATALVGPYALIAGAVYALVQQSGRTVDILGTRMSSLESALTGRMDGLDGRLDRLDGRVDRLADEVSGLRAGVAGLDARLSTLEGGR